MKCPKLWTKVSIGELITFMTSGSRGWAKYYSTSGRLFLRIQNVAKNKLLLDDVAYVQPLDDAESRRTLVRPGDVLLSMTADLGRTAVVPEWLGEAHINQHLAILRVRDIDPNYLSAFLASPIGQRQFEKLNKGGVKAGLNFEDIRSVTVILPPLPEQRRIAGILDQADGMRLKRQQALALTDQFLRSTFLDLFGDPVANPKGWPELRLDEVADIQSGVTKGRKLNGQQTVSVPYMRVANVQDGHLVLDEIKEIEVMANEVQKFRLKTGDVLLTEGGDFDKLGRGTVWRGEIDLCIHQNHIFRVRPRESKVLPEFLSAILASSRGKRYFLSAAKQTTGIASINKTQLSGFPVFLPPVALQDKFESIVGGHRTVVEQLTARFELVDNFFDSLGQRAFRGEL